jgi:hypothetical protein
MEQGSEELDRTDDDIEQPLEAIQLPMLPMNLAEEEVVGELEMQVQVAEEEVVGVPDVDVVE